jgi:hypothetical protein
MTAVLITVIVGLLVGYGVTVWYFWCGQRRREAAARRTEKRLWEEVSALEDKVGDSVAAVERMRTERAKISGIGTRSAADTDFLNKVKRMAEDTDTVFVFDAVNRGIYEAILTAPTDEMVLNAAGKGKGVRMLENTINSPERLFGIAEQDEREV